MSYANLISDVKSQVADDKLVKHRRAQIVAGAVELFSDRVITRPRCRTWRNGPESARA